MKELDLATNHAEKTEVHAQQQKEYQKQIEAAGGIYIIAKTFEGFINDLNNITWKEN